MLSGRATKSSESARNADDHDAVPSGDRWDDGMMERLQ